MAEGGGNSPIESSSDESSIEENELVLHNSVMARRLFIGNLTWYITKENVQTYFEKYGPLKHVQVVKEPIAKPTGGYGFVIFEDGATTLKVLENPDHIIKGQKILVQRPNIRQRSADANKVFVGGLSCTTTYVHLTIYFTRFGQIRYIVLPHDEKKRMHLGYAFIVFEKEGVAENVLALEDHVINDKLVVCQKPWTKKRLRLPIPSTVFEETPTELADDLLEIEPNDQPSTSKK